MEKDKINKLYLKVFLTAMLMWFVAQLPYLIGAKGAYVEYGDTQSFLFNIYRYIHLNWRNGMPLWDWNSDLGMNYIGSYSFFGLGSPYTLISLIFPEKAYPYAYNFIVALKYGVAACTAALYSRQYVKKDQTAFICGLLFAFSGVMFFNRAYHFHDIMSFFPLLLYCFDKLCTGKKNVSFALVLALSGITNYYIFWSECLFLLIYFIVRVVCKEIKLTKRLFFTLAAQTTLGVLMSAVLLLPSFFTLMMNSRASNSIFDRSLISYSSPGTVLKTIYSLFMIPDNVGSSLLFDSDYELMLTNPAMYVPLFSIVGVVYAIRSGKKKSWYTALLGVCAVMMVIPVLNSAFSAFNGYYYARWQFMPMLVMVMLTGKYIDDIETADIKKEVGIYFVAWGFFAVFSVIQMVMSKSVNAYYIFQILLPPIGIALLYQARYPSEKSNVTMKMLYRSIFIFCAAPFLFQAVYKEYISLSPLSDSFVRTNLNSGEPLSLTEGEPYRINSDMLSSPDISVLYGSPNVSYFHSLIPESTVEFYNTLGKFRGQNARIIKEEFAFFSFLSVKYELYLNKPLLGGVKVEPEDIHIKKYGYELAEEQTDFVLFENKNCLPMGFTYDHYMDIGYITGAKQSGGGAGEASMQGGSLESAIYESFKNESAGLDTYSKEMLLLKAIWLTDEQIEKYGDILTELPEDEQLELTEAAYEEDCAARRAAAAYEFTPNNSGFVSRIALDKPNLVFYSVPYDTGFTAYVDGAEVEIEKVFGGLCAVPIPDGDHEIRFEYDVRGLKEGVIISIASLSLIFAMELYYVISLTLSKKKNKK